MDEQKKPETKTVDAFEPDMDYFEQCLESGDMQGAMDCFGDRDPMEFL